jgi:dTDP-glucose 4,6-dehydratase
LEKGKTGSKYLIGGRCEKNNLQVLDALLAVIEKVIPAGSNPALKAKGFSSYGQLKKFVKDRPGHDRRYAIDPSKMERELGWKPKRTFEEGLLQTVQWYFSNLDWCEKVQKDKYDRGRLGLTGGKA